MPYSIEGLTINVRKNANFYSLLPELGFFIIMTQDKDLDFGNTSH
jgi:hypothetical protein